MKLLILGGTGFLGPHVVEAALERSHTMTLFNRGRTNPHLFPELEKLRGNRDGDLRALEGRSWDAVIDTSGYFPRVVSASANLLAGSVQHYVFVSSISVYADFNTPGIDETAPVGKLDDETVEEITGETYGPLKALCEQAAEAAFPGRTANIRPGLIVGPGDPSDRFTYWPARVARGGEVLAPGSPRTPVQFIDARDLARWIIRMIEDGHAGVFNATGPLHLLTFQEMLHGCKTVSGSDARFTWVDDAFLLEKEVGPWMELPLWLPEDAGGLMTVKFDRAVARGLEFRPPATIIRDTLEWDRTRPASRPWRAGMKPEKEAEVLAAWHAQEKPPEEDCETDAES